MTLPFLQCSNSQKFYHGFVYEEQTRKPIEFVLVKENTKYNIDSTYTNSKGYFILENKKDIVCDLTFNVDGYKEETAVTVWSQKEKGLNIDFLIKILIQYF